MDEASGIRFPVVNRGPLEGVVVLDFTTQLSGPLVTYLLAGFGATVIKIEEPGGDTVRNYAPFIGPDGALSLVRDHADAMSLPILNRGRGKHSVTLNLKAPGARELYRQMVERADVVVENYASGTAERLGIGYEATRAFNPRIIYCSLSGFGADAMGDRKALDIAIQAMSGITMASGLEGAEPVRVGMPIADTIAPLFAAMGINAALHRRDRTGEGEYIDVSMLGCLTALLAVEDWQAMAHTGAPMRTGNHMQRATPFGIYACRDGDIAIGAGARDRFCHALFALMGKPEMSADPRYATLAERCKRAPEINALVADWCAGQQADAVESMLLRAGIPVAKVRTPAEAVQDPLVNRRREVLDVLHPELGAVAGLKTIGLPVKFHRAQYGHGAAAPRLGEHNTAIYGDWLGLSLEELAACQAAGVV